MPHYWIALATHSTCGLRYRACLAVLRSGFWEPNRGAQSLAFEGLQKVVFGMRGEYDRTGFSAAISATGR
jgi:hypothetical protein